MVHLTIANYLECIAVISSIAYILLAAKQSFWCWPASILSCVIYAWICFDVKLYLESVLQFFYLLVSFYGWIYWKQNEESFIVTSNSIKQNVSSSFLALLIGLSLGFIAKKYTNAALPFVDAPIFTLSIYATHITASKKIESWIYWIVIDLVSVFIYVNRELYLTSFLFLLYTALAFKGYIDWQKSVRKTIAS